MNSSLKIIYVIFISQSEYGPYNRPVNGGTFFTDVSYASVKKGISACLLLKGEEEKIVYGNDYVYTEGVQNTIWALTRLYEKEVLGTVTDDERKMKENEFHSEFQFKVYQADNCKLDKVHHIRFKFDQFHNCKLYSNRYIKNVDEYLKLF